MYWSLMQIMVLSVLLERGVAVAMCIVQTAALRFFPIIHVKNKKQKKSNKKVLYKGMEHITGGPEGPTRSKNEKRGSDWKF